MNQPCSVVYHPPPRAEDALVAECLERAATATPDVAYAVRSACNRYVLLVDAYYRGTRQLGNVLHVRPLMRALETRLRVYVGPLKLWVPKPGDPQRRHT